MGTQHGWDLHARELPLRHESRDRGEGAEGRKSLHVDSYWWGELRLPLEEELAGVQEEITTLRAELEAKESGALPRIVNEDGFLAACILLEKRIYELVAEEQRLLVAIESED